ncbi:hypothetical protein PF005_g24375 [Phytophthora fragariae]|uniref:CBM1 domain-containing protein n=1 Tax=Phytophthora fragariae TaxID=53985 RepID=A0A6A3IE60_9STRA|nr:hypothetical protein PF011_g23102 [Phytophthora fragariae]KAE9177728.1 hypothetical protein PF005_g24375 [Phytophthora fragariae]KAE9185885.1 hypothetical protein PF004_g23229 [Phytophthora fragariae]
MKISAILFPAVLLSVAAARNPKNAVQQFSPVTPTPTQQQQPTPAPTVPLAASPTKSIGIATSAPSMPTLDTPTPYPTLGIQQSKIPTPAPSTTKSCTNVSVEGDAMYCIQGPVCGGSGDVPAGASCPLKGDIAVLGCIKNLPSWTATGTCAAPVDAICARKSGAWSCVYGQPHVIPTPAPTTSPSGDHTCAYNGSTKAHESPDKRADTCAHCP